MVVLDGSRQGRMPAVLSDLERDELQDNWTLLVWACLLVGRKVARARRRTHCPILPQPKAHPGVTEFGPPALSSCEPPPCPPSDDASISRIETCLLSSRTRSTRRT